MARYRGALASVGVPPTTIVVFSSLLPPDAPVELDEPPQAAASTNGKTPRVTVATTRRGLAILMLLLRCMIGGESAQLAQNKQVTGTASQFATSRGGTGMRRPVTGGERVKVYCKSAGRDIPPNKII